MNTKYLAPNQTALAAELLKHGGLVGIPTETVYGLGANGLDGAAVAGIFTAKGRPQDNPLILHLADVDWLERCCLQIPEAAYALAGAFWPGPLTMILHRNAAIPDAVTAGLDTVGVRCPDHALCREIIRQAGVPIAAPSGNRSGRPSPTTAQEMLEDMQGRIHAVMDGGPCAIGLESTILDLTCTPPRLLRPGGITVEQLRGVLEEVDVDEGVLSSLPPGQPPRAPGMQYRHYAPKAPVTVVVGLPENSSAYITAHAGAGDGVLCFEEFTAAFPGCVVQSIGPVGEQQTQARRIFSALRAFDHTNVGAIWAQCPQEKGLGLAICNRLYKAAGFHIKHV